MLYNSVLKHKFDLQSISINNQSQKGLAFIPSHPYSFQIALTDQKKQSEAQQQSYLQVKQQQQESYWEEEPVQDEQGSVIMWQIDEDEAEYSEQDSKVHRPGQQQQQEKKGLFDQLMDKLKKKPEPKVVKITLAAESEMKRRQWIYSINYYKSYHEVNSNKSSQVSHHLTPIPSQYHGQSTPLRSSFFRSSVNNTNVRQFNTFSNCINSQVFLGGNHTHINMNVGFFNLGGDDDYYDVFKDQSSQKKDSRQQTKPEQPSHCYTDPNEPRRDPEQERLITQPSKDIPRKFLPAARMMKSEIKSTSSIELWQKFLICFFRYLSAHQKPSSFVSQRGADPFLTQQSQQQLNFQQSQQQVNFQQTHQQQINFQQSHQQLNFQQPQQQVNLQQSQQQVNFQQPIQLPVPQQLPQQQSQAQQMVQFVQKDFEEGQEPKVQRLYSRKLYVNKPK